MFKNIIFLSVTVLLTSMMSFAIDAGGLMGPTGNMGIGGTGPRTDVNLTPGHTGTVGQMDWRAFSPAQGAKVDFGFSAVEQSLINRADSINNKDIMNGIAPIQGTYNSMIAPEDIKGENQMNNIDLSSKINNINNNINSAGVAGKYSNNGNIIIETKNLSK